MIDLTVYLVECSLLLGVLYGIYWVLLRKGRLFTLNRFFLLSVFAGSFLIPLIDIDLASDDYTYIAAPATTLSDARTTYYEKMDEWMVSSATPTNSTPNVSYGEQVSSSWVLIGLISVYLTGLVLALIRMSWVYFTLMALKRKGDLEKRDGLTIVKLDQQMAPFSFMKCVFVSKDQAADTSFQQILDHERTHIRERHSIDLMIVQFLAALQWFNPAAWWLIKSLKTTHEYIADQKMITKGYSVVEYQTLLLQQLISNNSYGLVHNFNLTFIKKRIAMMKIQKISWTSKTQMVLATSLSLLIAFITVQCNAKLDQVTTVDNTEVVEATPLTLDLPVIAENGLKPKETEDAIVLEIRNSALYVDGQQTQIADLSSLAQKSISNQGVIILRIDKNQTMGFVRSVQDELREADRRKIVYAAVTANGKGQSLLMLLPPSPDAEGNRLPTLDDTYIKTNDISLLYVDLGAPISAEHADIVYHFVNEQREQQKSNYVVSAKFDDNDSFESYLANLQYIMEGFNRIYDERAQQLYGKSWWDIDRFVDDENKAQYHAVRKGIPRAISISERD